MKHVQAKHEFNDCNWMQCVLYHILYRFL